jgi:uncharacterized protein
MKRVLVVITFLLTATVSVFAQRAVPSQGGYFIHDDANVLSQQDKAMLEYLVKAEDDSTSNQIAVLIIPSLDGDDIDSYSFRVAKEWKLGDDKKDNGILWLIAIKERQMRIEVGRGLEGVLTDAQSSRIDRNRVAPYFRQGDYSTGVKEGVVAIIQTVKGEYVNDQPIKKQRGKKPVSWISLIVLLIFIIISARRGGGGSGGYMSRGGWIMMGGLGGRGSGGGGGFGGSSGSWGGGGSFGGGGSSDSW